MDLYYIGMILYLYGMKQYHICMESYSVKLCLTEGGKVSIFKIDDNFQSWGGEEGELDLTNTWTCDTWYVMWLIGTGVYS